MILKPQDVVVLLKIIALGGKGWSYPTLAAELSVSASEVHSGLRRAIAARLAESDLAEKRRDGGMVAVRRGALEEFLVHGVKYAFPPDRGGATRGMPTAHASQFFDGVIEPDKEMVPVWPDPLGKTRGYAFSPLYRSVPKAARSDVRLYELLAHLDAIRDGRARERDIAIKAMKKRLSSGW